MIWTANTERIVHVSVPLRVRRPEDHHVVDFRLKLEVLDVAEDLGIDNDNHDGRIIMLLMGEFDLVLDENNDRRLMGNT